MTLFSPRIRTRAVRLCSDADNVENVHYVLRLTYARLSWLPSRARSSAVSKVASGLSHCLILTGEREPRRGHGETKFAVVRLGCFFSRQQTLFRVVTVTLRTVHSTFPSPDLRRCECYENPDRFCYASWTESPVALPRRLDRASVRPSADPESV